MLRLLLQERAALREGSGDEMIISAGDFLVHALKPAARRLAWERSALCGMAFAAVGEPATSESHRGYVPCKEVSSRILQCKS